MLSARLPATFEHFTLPPNLAAPASIAIPTVKGTWTLRYGKHAYYFMNLRTAKGLCVSVGHRDIVGPGLSRLQRASTPPGQTPSLYRRLTRRYHYGFSALEQLMLMTVPHTVTSIGHGRFIINLWSYFGYLVVDCRERSVTYQTLEETEDDHVLGSQQWYDSATDDLVGMSYSLKDSFRRLSDPGQPVAARIFRHTPESDATETLWSGPMADFMHDIAINQPRQYCVACELGMYLDDRGNIIPSKVLVLDLKNRKEWMLDRFIVAAHAQFDSQDPAVFYVSNHNFQFGHSSLFTLLKKATYSVKFRGPATVFKYRLTPEGPREIGSFSRPDFFRLTNMHVFRHRGHTILAAMGFPDDIFLVDADTMSFSRKVHVQDPCSWRHGYSKKAALIGTFSPSLDGEQLYAHTTRSFQSIDVETGRPNHVRDCFFNHSCSNHMLTTSDTDW